MVDGVPLREMAGDLAHDEYQVFDSLVLDLMDCCLVDDSLSLLMMASSCNERLLKLREMVPAEAMQTH